MLKVDYEKTYGTISWNYLRFFLTKWVLVQSVIKWMETCLLCSFMSMLVNGSATKDFNVERGLRQGSLLSLFSFDSYGGTH